MSSKKLLEQCQKLEKLWNHVFTATITLANITQENQWYNKLTDMIDKQQTAPIWMSDAKVMKKKLCQIATGSTDTCCHLHKIRKKSQILCQKIRIY